MRAYCDNPMSRASSAAQHTLTRHSDILKGTNRLKLQLQYFTVDIP